MHLFYSVLNQTRYTTVNLAPETDVIIEGIWISNSDIPIGGPFYYLPLRRAYIQK